jgi:DNA-binding CsgD family transcriptional regulator
VPGGIRRRLGDGAGHTLDVTLRGVVLTPEHAGGFRPGAPRLVCLMLDIPSRLDPRRVHAAMVMFDLTRKEAIVGLYLANGHDIADIARLIGVSRNTVRTHAAMVREKLHVHSSLSAAARLRSAMAFVP